MREKAISHYHYRKRNSRVKESRSRYKRIRDNPIITTANQVYTHLASYHHCDREHFIAITLDGASRVIGTHIISIGTLNQSLVHPRELFVTAIRDKAAAIIIAHNHPSEQLSPSHEDKKITARLKEAGKLIGIEIVDHIILSDTGYYSFQEDGTL